jgi:hypothetical protein
MHHRVAPVLLIVALCTIGCGRGTARSVTLNPSLLGVSDLVIAKDSTRAGEGGVGIAERKPDEIVVGFERSSQADPARDIQHFYRGGIRFDLSALSSLKSKVINKATLNFKVIQSYVRSADGTPAPFPNTVSCATELYSGTDEWITLVGTDGYTFKAALPVNALIHTLDRTALGGFHIDVTDAARQWIVSVDQNTGVVLKGGDERDTPGRNDACATRYNGITLDVQYTVFEP